VDRAARERHHLRGPKLTVYQLVGAEGMTGANVITILGAHTLDLAVLVPHGIDSLNARRCSTRRSRSPTLVSRFNAPRRTTC
jgi:hypothetical protein